MARAKFTISVLVILFIAPAQARAQFAVPSTGQPSSGVIRSAPRDLQRYVEAAADAIEDRRFAEAVTYLGGLMTEDVINDTVNQDYFIIDRADGSIQTQLRQRVHDLIGSMPKPGRELYEVTYGAEARAKLKTALEQQDILELQRVVRRYFHTQAGYEACLILGRYQLSRGRPLGAALSLERLYSSPARLQYDPQLSVMLAASWRLANLPNKSRRILNQLVLQTPDASIKVGGVPIALPDAKEDVVAWLDKVLATNEPLVRQASEDWTMFLGSPDRNGQSRGSAPLPSLQWFVRTATELNDENAIKSKIEQFERQNIVAIPSLQPLVVEDFVLMRTAKRLFGVNMLTGKRVWVYPWEETAYERSLRTNANQAPKNAVNMRQEQLEHRIWQDIPYGHLSSNGKDVYVLKGLGLTSKLQANIGVFNNGIRLNNPAQPKDFNELVSLQLIDEEGRCVEGKTRWRVGGINGIDEPDLAGAFFLSTPVAQDGNLYSIAEMNGQIELVVMSSDSGELHWKQQLAQIDGFRIDMDTPRRLYGAIPSLAGNVAICPTNAGAIVAVDLANRSLLWGFRYQKSQPKTTSTNARVIVRTNRAVQPPRVGEYWLDGAPIVADGRVVITPNDSDKIYCLDFLTGKEPWDPVDRDGGLYVACVYAGNIIVVAKNEVRAISLSQGKEVWTVPLKMPPSGRGMRSDGQYYLPIGSASGSQLLTLDLEKGEIGHYADTEEPLGNLVGYKDYIVSQSAARLTGYFRIDPLRKLVKARLDADPDDVDSLTLNAELLSFDNRQSEAITVLKRANRLDPTNDRTRGLLVRTLLIALRDDFVNSRDAAMELKSIIDNPQQKSEFLRLMSRGYASSGQIGKAFESFLALAQHERMNAKRLDTPDNLVRRNSQLEVRSDRWVLGRFAELYAKAEENVVAQIDQQIQTELEQALAADSSDELERFLEFFGSHKYGDQAKLALALRLIKQKAPTPGTLRAELLLEDLVHCQDVDLAGRATAALSNYLVKLGLNGEAAPYVRLLESRFADVVCDDEEKTGKEIFVTFESNVALKKFVTNAINSWPAGQVTATPSSERALRLPSYYRMYPIKLTEQTGNAPAGTRLVYDHQGNRLVVRSPYGDQIGSVSLRRPDNRRVYTGNYHLTQAKMNGHLIVLSLGYELVGIDLLAARRNANAIVWRQPLVAGLPTGRSVSFRINQRPLQTPFGQLTYEPTDSKGLLVGQIGPLNSNGVAFQVDGIVTSIDPQTGKELWRRNNVPSGCRLFGNREVVIMQSDKSADVLVLNTHDGTLKETIRRDEDFKVWSSWGTTLLEWKEKDGRYLLRSFDYFTNKEVWSRSLLKGTRASLIENGDEIVILQPDGEFEILALSDDKRRLAGFVEDEDAITSVYALRSKKQYLLFVNRPPTSVSNDSVQPVPSGHNTPLVHAKVYAYGRESGRSEWQTPALVEHFGLPLDQPAESPVLVFMRHRTPKTGASRKQYTSIACLDKRDGSLLMQEDSITTMTYFYQMVAEPNESQVAVMLPSRSFILKFTDNPTAPAPPAQVVSAPPTPEDKRKALFNSGSARGGDPFNKDLDDLFGEP